MSKRDSVYIHERETRLLKVVNGMYIMRQVIYIHVMISKGELATIRKYIALAQSSRYIQWNILTGIGRIN